MSAAPDEVAGARGHVVLERVCTRRGLRHQTVAHTLPTVCNFYVLFHKL